MTRAIRKAPTAALLVFAVGSLAVSGCTDPKQEEEIREARATVAKLELRMTKALEEISTLKAELNAVKQSREELGAQVGQFIHERDQALSFAQQAQEAITQLTARGSGQADVADLNKQVVDLTALVEEQQALIEQLQEGAMVDITADTLETPVPAPEPNQGL